MSQCCFGVFCACAKGFDDLATLYQFNNAFMKKDVVGPGITTNENIVALADFSDSEFAGNLLRLSVFSVLSG